MVRCLPGYPNSQPVVLDTAGSAFIFGSGNYTETLNDANGNLIWSGFTFANAEGNVTGPLSSGTGDLAAWGNTTGTQLTDPSGGVINGQYAWSGNQYFRALAIPGLT